MSLRSIKRRNNRRRKPHRTVFSRWTREERKLWRRVADKFAARNFLFHASMVRPV